ncbi:shikimate kinase [Occultella glacieicola]|uniref:Shikimate kinase n=1 Tax=Occultella glacieicola TaxID=2518684 RepID=A0ABY2E1X8_9MICO|nr:shikimate kinase [Occultella glacieicola]TDE92486.1 shikimate kinase [Occultella glacieicola]
MSAATNGPALILIGPPGAGKSTVGHLLAAAWGTTFRDTDADVEAAAGRSIPDIFIDDGEEVFRALERTAVATALAEHDGILALGGGAVLDEGTQAALAGRRVVYLSVSLAHASPRVGLSGNRPLLVGSPRRQWQVLMDARRPVYTALASVEVSTDGRSPEQVRDAVLAEVALP